MINRNYCGNISFSDSLKKVDKIDFYQNDNRKFDIFLNLYIIYTNNKLNFLTTVRCSRPVRSRGGQFGADEKFTENISEYLNQESSQLRGFFLYVIYPVECIGVFRVPRNGDA